MSFIRRKQTTALVEPIEIFQAGTHTAMSGQTSTFSEQMLQACADAYDPQKHEAPIVLGHPAHNAPAYGWIESLYVDGKSLFANVKDVAQEFSDMVREGRFKKISSSFWQSGSRDNPVSGSLYLRHVGFLGAAVPAVKGMRNAEFSDDGSNILTFGDDDYSGYPSHIQTMLRGSECEAFIESMINAGRIVTGHREGLIAFMGSLSNDDVLSFADPQGTIHNAGSLQWFRNYISSQPKLVEFGQLDIDEDEELPDAPTNIPFGFKVDQDNLELHNRATRLADEKQISYSDAVLLAVTELGE